MEIIGQSLIYFGNTRHSMRGIYISKHVVGYIR